MTTIRVVKDKVTDDFVILGKGNKELKRIKKDPSKTDKKRRDEAIQEALTLLGIEKWQYNEWLRLNKGKAKDES